MTEYSQQSIEGLSQYIPWGSSTCSKKATLLPEEPQVIIGGKGCRVWDKDGKEYIDFRNALGPVTLGYCFETIDNAIKEQLDSGIIFGYPHPLEWEVAKMLCDIIPCAERARFLKTGGEAIAACIRIARYCTGKKHIVQIGYNGWLNSLSAGARVLPGQKAVASPPGVPLEISSLHHTCDWCDTGRLEQIFNHNDDIAAIVVAADYENMEAGKTFYPFLRELTERHGSLLIFDEIVTGFRIARGGVQEYFNVTPDMAVFAKGIANGMPLAAYVGKAKYMDQLEKVIISSTYGGETLSLAAARAVMEFYEKNDVIGHLWHVGRMFRDGFAQLLKKYNIPAEIKGMPPVSFIYFSPEATSEMIEKFYRSIFKQGVCLYRGGYVNYSHNEEDILEALSRIEKGLENLW